MPNPIITGVLGMLIVECRVLVKLDHSSEMSQVLTLQMAFDEQKQS